MPYAIKQKPNGKWTVVNKITGEDKGESATKEMAIAHMRALYANEPKH